MPTVGPQLPPHLADKRKRDDADADDTANDTADDRGGQEGEADSTTGTGAAKRPRVIGPALPPAPLDERPTSSPGANHNNSNNSSDDDNDDDDDDDFGPALPTTADTKKAASIGPQQPSSATATSHQAHQQQAAPSKRDEWMTMAPTSGDWSARIDPTKLKNRKFASGKAKASSSSAGGNAAAASAMWHETPEQKQARLQRELMGVKDHSYGNSNSNIQHHSSYDERAEAAAARQRIKEYNESRGPSLYQTHQQQSVKNDSKQHEEDDDPSARPFDREKDIAGGLQINSTKRREMMQKASNFGSRFSAAKYL